MKKISTLLALVLVFFYASEAQHTSPIDSSFADGGTLVYSQSSDYTPVDMKVLPDDRILILTNLRSSYGQFRVLRYNADGKSIDHNFGYNFRGHTTLGTSFGNHPIPFNLLYSSDLQVQPDGKILVASVADQPPGSSDREMSVVRLQQDGKLDTAFGDGGVAIFRNAGQDQSLDLSLAADGSILLSGEYRSCVGCTLRATIVKFDPQGVVDSTFGINGYIEKSDLGGVSSTVGKMLIQPDGKIVHAVWKYFYDAIDDELYDRIHINRYMPDGQADTSFAFGGLRSLDYFKNYPITADLDLNDLQLMPDGRILVFGSTRLEDRGPDGDQADWNITTWRLKPDGMLDSTLVGPYTLGLNGDTTFFYGRKAFAADSLPYDDYGVGMLQDGNKLWLFGQTDPDMSWTDREARIARVNMDGSPDTSFGSHGSFTMKLDSTAESSYFMAGHFQSDNKLITLMSGKIGRYQTWGLVRFGSSVSTSIETQALANTKLVLYPNPATDKLYIEGADNHPETTITVYDLYGKKLLETSYREVKDQGLDIRNLNAGTYLIVSGSDSGSLARRFVVR